MSYFDQNHTRDPWPNCTAWHNFTEGAGTTVADSGDNAYTLTATGSPTWGATDAGNAAERFSTGSYLTFNGTTQYARTTTSHPLDTVPDAWFISFRVKFPVSNASGKRVMFKFNQYATGAGGLVYEGFSLFTGGNDALVLAVDSASGSFQLAGLKALEHNTWYQVTIGYWDGAYQLWIDDRLDNFRVSSVRIANADGTKTPFVIGAQHDGSSAANFAACSIGRLRIVPYRPTVGQLVALMRCEPEYPAADPEAQATRLGVLLAPGTGDSNSIQEPNWLQKSDGTFEALARVGWDSGLYFRYFSSTDFLTWTRGAIVIGGGAGGESGDGCQGGAIVLKGGTYYKFYSDGSNASQGVAVATATAMSGPWAKQGGAIIRNDAAGVTAYGTRVAGPGILWDEQRSMWVGIGQIYTGSTWVAVRITSTVANGLSGWTVDTDTGLLLTLRSGSGMFGGYCLRLLSDGRYLFVYHVSNELVLPTFGRHAVSSDGGKTWQKHPIPLGQIRHDIPNQDQWADPWAGDCADGTSRLMCSVTYNGGSTGSVIGYSIPMRLEDWLLAAPSVGVQSGRYSQAGGALGIAGPGSAAQATAATIASATTSGMAQSGSTSTTIKLAMAASTVNDLYNGQSIWINGGTGAGQRRGIADYVGSTRVLTVDQAWITTPDSTSTYIIGERPAVIRNITIG